MFRRGTAGVQGLYKYFIDLAGALPMHSLRAFLCAGSGGSLFFVFSSLSSLFLPNQDIFFMQEWGCAPCPFLCDMICNIHVSAPEAPTIIDESSIIFQILIPSLPFISLLLIPFRYSRARWTSNVTNQLRLCLNCYVLIFDQSIWRSLTLFYTYPKSLSLLLFSLSSVPSAISLVRRQIPTRGQFWKFTQYVL